MKTIAVSLTLGFLFLFRNKLQGSNSNSNTGENTNSASTLDLVANAISNGIDSNLSLEQIDSINNIFNEWTIQGDGDNRKLAYIFATAWHESFLTPIEEIRANPNTNPNLYQLQNAYWNTGFYGRGYVQLTHRENYLRFTNRYGIDLINNPDLALDRAIASRILVDGMYNGLFTGVSLNTYFKNDTADWFNARKIVNGTDRAQKISDIAQSIYAELNPIV